MKKYLIFTVAFLFLSFACVVFAQKSSDLNKDQLADEEDRKIAKQVVDDIQSTYQSARELTLKGDKVLFLPDNKVGDAASAQSLYTRSAALLSKFFDKWGALYSQDPSLFALLDLLRAQNARGLAFAALVNNNTDLHAQYRHETIDIAQAALNYIKSSTFENPQFPLVKEQMQRYLTEAHFFLYIHYKSKNDSAKAKEHLKLAAETTPDPKAKAMLDQMLKEEK